MLHNNTITRTYHSDALRYKRSLRIAIENTGADFAILNYNSNLIEIAKQDMDVVGQLMGTIDRILKKYN